MLDDVGSVGCWKCYYIYYSSHLQSFTVTYRAAELPPYRLSSKAKLRGLSLSKSPRVIVCHSHIPRYSKIFQDIPSELQVHCQCTASEVHLPGDKWK